MVTSRGGPYSPDIAAPNFDLQEFYLKRILGFIGLTDITFIHAEHQVPPEKAASSVAAAIERISQAASHPRDATVA